jgi:hypothetical protein
LDAKSRQYRHNSESLYTRRNPMVLVHLVATSENAPAEPLNNTREAQCDGTHPPRNAACDAQQYTNNRVPLYIPTESVQRSDEQWTREPLDLNRYHHPRPKPANIFTIYRSPKIPAIECNQGAHPNPDTRPRVRQGSARKTPY